MATTVHRCCRFRAILTDVPLYHLLFSLFRLSSLSHLLLPLFRHLTNPHSRSTRPQTHSVGKTSLVQCVAEHDVLEREEVCPPPKRESGHRFRSVKAHSTISGKLAYRVRTRFQDNYLPTIAPNFELIHGNGYRAKLWDVSGDERYTSLAFPLADFHNIDVYILVFDVTKRSVGASPFTCVRSLDASALLASLQCMLGRVVLGWTVLCCFFAVLYCTLASSLHIDSLAVLHTHTLDSLAVLTRYSHSSLQRSHLHT